MKTARFETSRGSITAELFDEEVPGTVANFEKLANDGFYDGTRFHRVIDNFMIQGGDPYSRDPGDRRTGTGGPGYTIKCETHRNTHHHVAGTLSMAHWDDDRDSAETSFSIILGDAPHLDGNYTIFGRVESGWEAVEAIERAPVKYDSTEPAVEILIQSARSVRPDVQVTEK